jgi:septum formation protein
MTTSLWLAAEPLTLASASRIRRKMLEAAGIPVEVLPAHIDERRIEENCPGDGRELASRLAREKAATISRRRPSRLVLGADQTLTHGGTLFHKPPDADGGRRQLAALRGREHQLHSAAALARDGAIVAEMAASATLRMRHLDDAFISLYMAVAGSAVLTSVGGYQLEGLGVHLFDRIEGDHFTILGLPLIGVLAALRAEGCLAA